MTNLYTISNVKCTSYMSINVTQITIPTDNTMIQWSGLNFSFSHIYTYMYQYMDDFSLGFIKISWFLGFFLIKFFSSMWLNFFSPTCSKTKFRKHCLFIQTIFFIIFTCPNPFLLVPDFGQLGLCEYCFISFNMIRGPYRLRSFCGLTHTFFQNYYQQDMIII